MTYPHWQPGQGPGSGPQPQPGWGGNQPPPVSVPGGGSAIAVTIMYHPMSFLYAMFTPNLTVDGHPVAASWGRTVVPVPPGQHHIHVHMPYLLPPRVGPADAMLPVYPGQCLELEYRAPLITFARGALGLPPQRYNGMVATIVLISVMMVLVSCSCLIPLLG